MCSSKVKKTERISKIFDERSRKITRPSLTSSQFVVTSHIRKANNSVPRESFWPYRIKKKKTMHVTAEYTSIAAVSGTIADTAAVGLTDSKWANNPFHKGEIALQQLANVHTHVMSYAPRVIRSFMPEQHRQFFSELPFLVAAVRDGDGTMWATLLEKQFIDDGCNATTFFGIGTDNTVEVASSPDPKTLFIHAKPISGDVLEDAFQSTSEKSLVDVGLLGIMFETSRRNRVNGRARLGEDGNSLMFTVDQSFGNCPQYIKPRSKWFRRAVTIPKATTNSNVNQTKTSKKKYNTQLTATQVKWIESTETMFTATGYRGDGEDVRYGNDASHRGGAPGFVQVFRTSNDPDAGTNISDHLSSSSFTEIVWTEYSGNNHFNSLGNIILDPRTGLCFPNFATGGMLQVTGVAVVEMGSLDKGERKVRMRVTGVNELPPGSLPIRWNDDPNNSTETKAQVVKIVQESADVKSFYFKPVNGKHPALTPFRGGQYLPIKLTMSNGEVVHRSYSISGSLAEAVNEGYYRISVKHIPNGKASTFLHKHVQLGHVVTIGKPTGAFTRDVPTSTPNESNISTTNKQKKTSILLSAGIGITPLLSQLHEIVAEEEKRRDDDPTSNQQHEVVWIHGARTSDDYPFRNEINTILAELESSDLNNVLKIQSHVVYSRECQEQSDETLLNSMGATNATGTSTAKVWLKQHITTQLVQAIVHQNVLLEHNDTKIYMCGPASFLADMETGFEKLGVRGENIYFETF